MPCEAASATMAIDTPLGFSEQFLNLAYNAKAVGSVGASSTNAYLFRQTERHLFEQGLAPLSAIKDMIGSQATKGMHALAKYASVVSSCGIWTDGSGFTAIETYPAACRKSQPIARLTDSLESLGVEDLDDARVCALIAYLFANERSSFDAPSENIPAREGWIWVPLGKT